MRLAFWRSDTAVAGPAVPQVSPAAGTPVSAPAGELDFVAIGQALARKRNWIILPTLLAAVLSITAVNMITPRYRSEVRILIDGRENVFLRPNGERNDDRNALDAEAVTSQVQLLLSRDLARDVIKKNRLSELPEFVRSCAAFPR
jgi:polysaccharide biosynthesis transport protein